MPLKIENKPRTSLDQTKLWSFRPSVKMMQISYINYLKREVNKRVSDVQIDGDDPNQTQPVKSLDRMPKSTPREHPFKVLD